MNNVEHASVGVNGVRILVMESLAGSQRSYCLGVFWSKCQCRLPASMRGADTEGLEAMFQNVFPHVAAVNAKLAGQVGNENVVHPP